MKKKSFLPLPVLLLLLCLSLCGTMSAYAADVVDSGDCGSNASWTLDSDGTLTISGSGEIQYAQWYEKTSIKSVIIGGGITDIGEEEFAWCGMESVSLPESLTSIGAYAFLLCEKLEGVRIPANVGSIGESAFRACNSLTAFEVDAGNGNYSSENGVLFNKDKTYLICYPAGSSSDSYNLPDSVSRIAGDAFNRCFHLQNIAAGSGNSVYASQDGVLFNSNQTTLVRYPAGKTATQYAIPDSVTRIEDFGFYDCATLTELTIGVNLTEVGEKAFYDCSNNLTVHYAGTPTQWSAITIADGNDCLRNAYVQYPAGGLIAGGVCGGSAQEDSVTWELDTAGTLTISGEGSLCQCIRLTMGSQYLVTSPWWSYRDSIRRLVINEGVTTITWNAFSDCGNLREVVIPVSVTSIGSAAFYRCRNLTDIYYTGSRAQWNTLSSNIQTAIRPYPSSGTDTEDLYIKRATVHYVSASQGQCGVSATWTLSNGTLTIFGTGTMADYSADNGQNPPWYDNRTSVTSVVISDGITRIGNYAFFECENLTSVNMAEGVNAVGFRAFYGCLNLSEIALPQSLQDIETGAFFGCVRLRNLTIPNGVVSIGNLAFGYCSALESAMIPESVANINGNPFPLCTSLSSIEVAERNGAYQSIGGALFSKDAKTMLSYPSGRTSDAYDIPSGTETIGKSMFFQTTQLNRISIPVSVKTIENGAFYGCSNLADVYYAGTEEEWNAVQIGEQNTSLLNATIHYESPTPGSTVENSVSSPVVDGMNVTFTATCTEPASAWFAVYDENGKFLGAETRDLTVGSENSLSFTASKPGAAKFKIMLLADDGFSPLYASVGENLP